MRRNYQTEDEPAAKKSGGWLWLGAVFLAVLLCFLPVGGWAALFVLVLLISAGLRRRRTQETGGRREDRAASPESGAAEEVPRPRSDGDHDHIPSTALTREGRLEQLETLKRAGLVTEEEYRDRRREILERP